MAWFDEFNLPGATIDGYFGFIQADGPDDGDYPDVVLADGTVTFTATTEAARIDGAWLGIEPVTAQIFEGQIVISEEDPRPVRLLATDAPIGVADWAWKASFNVPGFRLTELTFKAPRDTTVNLTDGLIPIKTMPYQIIEGASIVDAEVNLDEATMRFELSNGSYTSWMDVPNGERGLPGATGEKGDPGADGSAATLAMGTVTAGTTADAWMTGTPLARELHLTLPRGQKGDRGDAGPPGPEGPQGIPGTYAGKGDSAYQVAVAEGFAGTESEWLASLKGEPGEKGDTPTWADLADKPTAYPPATHQHAQADVTGLAASLSAKMNVAATGIVNVDLNGLFTPGVYSQGSSTTAANPDLHYPAPYACRILVMASPTLNQVTQVVWTYFATAQSEMYWRSFIGGSWGPWARVATEADLAGLVKSTDQRLSDARTPLPHTHAISGVEGLADALAAAGDAAEVEALSLRIDGLASAYDVWLGQGNTGTEADFLASLQGPAGPEGPYGGTSVTDPQVAAWVGDIATQTGAKLDARYRTHVSVMEHGAAGDGSADDTAAVQAALSAGAGGTVYFPPGRYLLTAPLAVPRDTTISGAGSSSVVLDWSTMSTFRAVSLLAWEKGTVGAGIHLASDVQRGSTAVTLATGHGVTVGDTVRVLSDEVIVSGEATKAEFQRVLSVDGETVTFGAPLFDSYSAVTGARVQKTDLTTGGLSGVSVQGKGVNPSGYGDTVVEFSLAQDVTVSDVKFRGVENKCLLMNSVVGLSVSDCYFWFDPSFTPLQYGIAATGACQFVSIRGVHSWNDRHMFTTSTSSTTLESRSEYRGIPRFVSITGCTAYGSWQSPIDTHRGGEYITITGNSLTSESAGVKIRGANVLISGNTIVGKTTSNGGGPNGIYIGMLCDGIQIVGNLIRGFRDGVRFDTPDQPSRGLVVSSNQIIDCERPVFIGSSSTMYRLKIDGNYLRALPGSNNYPVYLVTGIEDIEITGNTLEGGNMGVYMASLTLPMTRALVQGNVVRNQASFGMFFRNLSHALVSGNHVATSDIRFSDVCENVTTGLNLATITDLTTGNVITQK